MASAKPKSEGVKARDGEEVWLNVNAGKIWYKVSDPRVPGRSRTVSVKGGAQIRISTEDRELNSADIFDAQRDPFLNGALKRVDERAEAEPIEGYQAEQALTEDELTGLLAKSGQAFQSAVKKLDERNVRKLAEIVEDEESGASVAQATFVRRYVAENYRGGGQTTSGKEILAEQAGPAADA